MARHKSIFTLKPHTFKELRGCHIVELARDESFIATTVHNANLAMSSWHWMLLRQHCSDTI